MRVGCVCVDGGVCVCVCVCVVVGGGCEWVGWCVCGRGGLRGGG